MSLFERLRNPGRSARPGAVGMLRRRHRWEPTWLSFPGVVADTPAIWSVDLGAVEAAPLGHLPVRVDIEVQYQPGPDGLPGDAVADRAEDGVRAIAASQDGVYIGRVVSGGVCRFTVHLPAEPPMSAAVAQLPGATMRAEYDPHWAYVRDTLAPDERQHQWLTDRAMVQMLSEQGDPLATPREVAHVAIFAEHEPAERAAAALRAEGFTAAVARDDEGEFELTALRTDPVAPPTVHELTWRVKETIERHGGSYDGWNCQATPGA